MFVNVNGLKMHYETYGQGHPVVLLHGLGMSEYMWHKQVPAISQKYQAIAVDVRGHGATDAPPGPYTMTMLVADILGLFDELDLVQPVLVGLSMGGGITQSVALTAPHRLSGTGLISTGSEFLPATRAKLLHNADLVEQKGMAAVIDSQKEFWSPTSLERHADVVARMVDVLQENSPHGYAAAARVTAMRDWTARLPEIELPVIYIGGALDPSAPQRAELFREGLRDVEIHLLPGVSHLLPLEAPEVVNDLLLQFLDRVLSSRVQ